MRRIKQLVITSLCVISISSQSLAAPTCQDVIQAADKAIEAKNKEIQICRLALSQTIDRATRLEQEVKDRDEKLNSPLRNPFVMTAAGILIGIIAVGYATRK